MLKHRILTAALALATLAPLTACDDDDLEREDVAGTYTATEFSITTGSEVIDVLDLGGEITLVLNADGTTEGTFDAPAIEDEPAATYDLEGTWDIEADLIVLDHDADTFLRHVVFEYQAGQLIASELFTEGVFDLTLTRSSQQ